MTGCGAANEPAANEEDVQQVAESPAAPVDLTGTWKQSNSGSEDSYQQATITDETISIDWVSDGGDTSSIYWVGTFDAPTEAADTHTVTSERDVEATEFAMLASGDDTKDFTIGGDTISYKVSALGTTTKVELKKD